MKSNANLLMSPHVQLLTRSLRKNSLLVYNVSSVVHSIVRMQLHSMILNMEVRNLNTIKNNVITGGTASAGRIILSSGSDHKVVGNSITGSPSGVILVSTGNDIDVIRNDIHDAGTGGSNATISYYGTDSSATFTVDAGTDIVTSSSHGISDGQNITLTSSTTLPAGLSASTTYYVNLIDANTFYLVTTRLDANGTPNPTADAATAVDITDTGTGTHTWHIINSAGDCDVVHNVLHNCGEIGVEFLGGSDNNHVVGNIFHDCAAGTSLIKYVDGVGHLVHMNDLTSGASTSIDLGSVGAADIGILGNNLIGYGTGSMGLTGTAAVATEAAWVGYNYVAP